MSVGTGLLWFFLLLVALSVVASVWPRWFCPLFGGIGLFLGIFFVASAVFQWSFPIQFFSVVFIFAVIFIVSGVIGGLVLFSQSKTKTRTERVFSKLAVATASALAIFVAGIIALIVLDGVLFGGDPVDDMQFDATVWRSSPAEHSHESIRLRMVNSLIESGALVGKKREEIESLLGPRDVHYYSGFDGLVYQLGAERWSHFAIDSEWLFISFGPDGTVSSIETRSD